MSEPHHPLRPLLAQKFPGTLQHISSRRVGGNISPREQPEIRGTNKSEPRRCYHLQFRGERLQRSWGGRMTESKVFAPGTAAERRHLMAEGGLTDAFRVITVSVHSESQIYLGELSRLPGEADISQKVASAC